MSGNTRGREGGTEQYHQMTQVCVEREGLKLAKQLSHII
jgi:hypothetical protein